MAFDYAEAAQDALDSLAEFGALTTVIRAQQGAYNPATGEAPALPPLTVSAMGVVLEYSAGAFASGLQKGALIQAGDKQLLLSALDVIGEPVPPEVVAEGASVTGPDGLPYVLKRVKTLAPAGTVVLFDCTIRKPG